MLKQDEKIINAEFVQTCALSQLSFVQFRPSLCDIDVKK